MGLKKTDSNIIMVNMVMVTVMVTVMVMDTAMAMAMVKKRVIINLSLKNS